MSEEWTVDRIAELHEDMLADSTRDNPDVSVDQIWYDMMEPAVREAIGDGAPKKMCATFLLSQVGYVPSYLSAFLGEGGMMDEDMYFDVTRGE